MTGDAFESAAIGLEYDFGATRGTGENFQQIRTDWHAMFHFLSELSGQAFYGCAENFVKRTFCATLILLLMSQAKGATKPR
jgi:hypothetical protein